MTKMIQLGMIEPRRLSGTEKFSNGRTAQDDFDVLDFWRWSCSDLLMNTTRGVLAEYLVARALGIPTSGVRGNWAAFDLVTADGIRIEVKSSAYLQCWAQERLSTIQFLIPARRGWDAETNVTSETASRQADVYVFALLAHTDKRTVDPLELSQWLFWAVPTKTLGARTRSQHSITLNSLQRLAGPGHAFDGLSAAFEAARLTQKNQH